MTHDIIVSALMAVFNAIIGAFTAAFNAAVALLPDMPTLPTLPVWATDALHWTSWFFPVGTVIDIVVFMVGAWLLWQAVAVAMRWLRMLPK
jgi:hypothetical protein